MTDAVVIGAGAVGAACAYFLARAGASVTVLSRGPIVDGTSSACEGNLLVSDKEPGPELDLALYSRGVWSDDLGAYASQWEFEHKGGLIVASSEPGLVELRKLSHGQRGAGVQVEFVDAAGALEREPLLRTDIAGAAWYPQDCQVQPMLATAHLLRLARELGARVRTHTEVTGLLREQDRVVGVRTNHGPIRADRVVNAAGPWAGKLAALAGVRLPVEPRRGCVLVTQPATGMIHHKVYAGEYVASTQSSDAGVQVSTVIEGTPSGTILIGSSRERVGFSTTIALGTLRQIARQALELFPALAGVQVMRSYVGFRPYLPDHLPAIGADPRAPGLAHATGHEGAGIGLSVGTGKLLAQQLSGVVPDLDLAPFAPERFGTAPAELA